ATNQELEDWNVIYNIHNKVACLMVGSMSPKLHRKFENYSLYDLLQELKSMFEKQAKVKRNYNTHKIGKTISELNALLIEYEKGLPKKAATSQVLAIQGGRIQIPTRNRRLLKGRVKQKRKNYPVYLFELMKKKKQAGSASTLERATDILGLIHIDVCGPLMHLSRQDASYFITFADDLCRYEYVYLLKHKHEIFETFKVFKNEVEKQLEKTIKALRSDLGGEYISQEFKDYLKACETVQQFTPPYTPQHNDMSERRNRTLLTMIDAMNAEMQSMKDNQVWCLVDLPPNAKTVRSKWHFKKKTNMDENVHTYKAHLVAKGYTQTYGIHYEETFSLVADIRAIRILIAMETHAEFFEKNLISQKANGRAVELEEIQDEDISPSKNTSEHLFEAESLEP
nr:putative polyprotein [Tanacetum cinerariifolium]